MPGPSGKRVCMVIAPENFRDEELFDTKKVLEAAGATVTVASRTTAPSKGMLGKVATPEISLDKLAVESYDALVFVGGYGAETYFDDARCHDLARTAAAKGKVVAAICVAPSILANAGLLKGKKATVWNGEKYIAILKKRGATYTGEAVVREGRIVTADGPASATKFGEALVQALR